MTPLEDGRFATTLASTVVAERGAGRGDAWS